MDFNAVWQDYGLDRLQEGMNTLFPQKGLSLEHLLGKVISGDIMGALVELFTGSLSDFQAQFAGMKNILVWLLIMGILSSLMYHFVEIFDRHQVADISF